MAAVLPLVAVFVEAGSIAAGVSALGAGLSGAAGFAGFLSSAGSILGAVGAISGNKKLAKVGALMGLGGGLMGGMSASVNAARAGGSASSAASAADAAGAADASSAWDAAGSAAGSDAGMLSRYGNLGQSAGQISETLANGGPLTAAGSMGGASSLAGADLGNFDSLTNSGLQSQSLAGETIGSTNPFTDGAQPPQSIFERLSAKSAAGGDPSGVLSPNDPMAAAGTPASRAAVNLPANDPLAAKTGKMTVPEILKKIAGGGDVNSIPEWIKQNKELVQLGGNMLYGMYGPQAEQLDWQKSIMSRRLANLNSPVRLGIRQPALAGMGG